MPSPSRTATLGDSAKQDREVRIMAENVPALQAHQDATQEDRQVVVFDLAGEAYGVDINAVREIIRMRLVTAVPRTPEFVEGVINIRGKVIPVVDLRRRFGLPIEDESTENRIVVVDIAGQDLGMIVDAVKEVMRIPISAVEPPSAIITTQDSEFLRGIAKLEDRMVILLDLDRILSGTEKESIRAVAA